MTKAEKYVTAIKKLFAITNKNYLTALPHLTGGQMINAIDKIAEHTDWINPNGIIKDTITWTLKDSSQINMSMIMLDLECNFRYGLPSVIARKGD